MRAQQEQLDQQYNVQQNEWERYQQQQHVEQVQQWEEFQRQMQMNQQQMAQIQPQNYQQPPQYYTQQPQPNPDYFPAPSMPRQGSMVASYPPMSPPMQAMSTQFGPSASQAAGSMPAMSPQFGPVPMLPTMPNTQTGYGPVPSQPGTLYGSLPGAFPAQGAPNLYGSQIGSLAPTTNPYAAHPTFAPGPSAFSQVGSQQPVSQLQPAKWTQPQDGPTDQEWEAILRQVDGM